MGGFRLTSWAENCENCKHDNDDDDDNDNGRMTMTMTMTNGWIWVVGKLSRELWELQASAWENPTLQVPSALNQNSVINQETHTFVEIAALTRWTIQREKGQRMFLVLCLFHSQKTFHTFSQEESSHYQLYCFFTHPLVCWGCLFISSPECHWLHREPLGVEPASAVSGGGT